MACADPGGFAGIASVEAVAVSSCDAAASVPLIEVASTGDPLLTLGASQPPKVLAGHVEPTVDALMAHWRQLEGCGTGGSRATYGNLSVTTWDQCRLSGRVTLAVYQGGRHAWPAGEGATPSAQQLIWSFFRQSDRHGPSDVR
jgi:poly(3-hydroxybutyrate) depolymerase